MGYDLGVDLGTTFVAAAVARDGQVEMCALGDHSTVAPAAVYRAEDSRLIFGEAAERHALSDPGRVERWFKRRLGDPTPVLLGGTPHEVTALMAEQLRDVLDIVSRAQGGPPDRVALTHPAGWGPYRRELFDEVPRLAGLRDHLVLTEPEAAAAYYGVNRTLGDGATIAVYDLGGGTFDATVLRKRAGAIEVVGEPEGIERLGGADFDEAIVEWINYRHGGRPAELDPFEPASVVALALLRQECVRAKEALSVDTEASISVLLSNRRFFAQLTRQDLESMIRPRIESTIGALVRAVHSARIGVDDLAAVLLVGGSARIPLIGQMITEELGCPIRTDAHPKHAVALGAATVAAAGVRPAVAGTRVLVGGGVPANAGMSAGHVRPHSPSPRGVSRPAPPGRAPGRTPPPSRTRRRRLAVIVLAVLALLGVLTLLLIGFGRGPAPAKRGLAASTVVFSACSQLLAPA
ncbi:hypothetical protein GCM10010172_12870 [Paractinoplanes ferrugineus]|uniref:Hsp70 protein n=1 Tax=Paractinoplanes ferrugineus TaxID=113564 RepID=A0A919IXQ0_9ACTN|nr:Hsp70 family protein [Actinoplanes ferrugineus]GIE09852.1 hypothetical protein Afe05nite_16920 [Actinoplanes ferrugineus]